MTEVCFMLYHDSDYLFLKLIVETSIELFFIKYNPNMIMQNL